MRKDARPSRPVAVVRIARLTLYPFYAVLLTHLHDGGRIPYLVPYVLCCSLDHHALTPTTTGSEQMSLVQLIVPTEVAHDTIAELGELGNVQFKDVSTCMQHYTSQSVETPRGS